MAGAGGGAGGRGGPDAGGGGSGEPPRDLAGDEVRREAEAYASSLGPDAGNPALSVEPRRRIFVLVRSSPGIHFRELQRRLGMPTGQLEHHLSALEGQGLVEAKEDRYYKRYYPRDFDARDREVIDAVRQDRPRRIVLELLLSPGLSHSELLERFPMSPSTLSFYLDHLLRAGLVERRRDGKSNRYAVVEPERVARALIAHRRSFLDRLVDNFAEAWISRDRAK